MPLTVTVAAASVGVLALVLYALDAEAPISVLATGLMLGGAAVVSGGLLGFLFGVPRASAAADTGDTVGPTRRRYRANTNLEQISDWLTKILVGVGLTQIGTLRETAGQIVQGISPALGGSPGSRAFGAGLLAYFLVIGFLAGWLVTQLYLGRVLSHADEALDAFIAAETEEASGNAERAVGLRDEAMQILTDSGDLSRRYESTRLLMSPGGPRTREMEAVMTAARVDSASGKWTATAVKQRFDTGQEGDRIYSLGLMQGDIGRLANLECVLDSVSRSRSAFEQYHALWTAYLMLDTLDPDQREQVIDAVKDQLGTAGRIKVGSQRYVLAQQILRSAPARRTE